jgi:hypothetical protein
MVLPESMEFSRDFQVQFLPLLRFNNPRLSWELGKKDVIELEFDDHTFEVIGADKIEQSHVLMEKVIGIDSQKHLLKDKYVPT